MHRGIEVQVHGSLKVATHVDRAIKKPYGMFAFIGQIIECKSWNVMLQLHITLVRPHLQYCV